MKKQRRYRRRLDLGAEGSRLVDGLSLDRAALGAIEQSGAGCWCFWRFPPAPGAPLQTATKSFFPLRKAPFRSRVSGAFFFCLEVLR